MYFSRYINVNAWWDALATLFLRRSQFKYGYSDWYNGKTHLFLRRQLKYAHLIDRCRTRVKFQRKFSRSIVRLRILFLTANNEHSFTISIYGQMEICWLTSGRKMPVNQLFYNRKWIFAAVCNDSQHILCKCYKKRDMIPPLRMCQRIAVAAAVCVIQIRKIN